MNIERMKKRVSEYVEACSQQYIGGQSYFDGLDGRIKNDQELVWSYIDYMTLKEEVFDVIASGEIGVLLQRYQRDGLIPRYIHMVVVNGGLRHDGQIENLPVQQIQGKSFIFMDDSYYSGSTAETVRQAVEAAGGKIIRNYVFYDGSPNTNENVRSLYRYYG